ncbi:hypothetical protein [Anabaena sp. UHCC 0399]|uniref:hypothetical protein n=1 Tax=Anabaena sp. UHCC 0399 TaxID=3110238 RepID=UPI002B20EA6C|nr:hypothetical protein [Anabaena sp. UHCC 0399]MEA5564991.1 hypothetical protein [Anabaena sp. UHCC 0399]
MNYNYYKVFVKFQVISYAGRLRHRTPKQNLTSIFAVEIASSTKTLVVFMQQQVMLTTK